jgi:hypothetical protein
MRHARARALMLTNVNELCDLSEFRMVWADPPARMYVNIAVDDARDRFDNVGSRPTP